MVFAGIYGFIELPAGLQSLAEGDNIVTMATGNNYFPLVAFIAMTFFAMLGAWPIPWMMLSEVFPFK